MMAIRRELILDIRKYSAALDESYRRSRTTARRKQRLWNDTGRKGEQSAKKVGDAHQRMGTRMEGIANRTKLAMIGAFTAITIAVSRMMRSTFGELNRFDQEMTKSLAIAGDTTMEQRRRMEETARQVSRTLNLELDKVAESYFFLFSAGLDVEESMRQLPQVAAFAKAGMFDLATATDLATDAQSALGMTTDDAEQNLRNLTRVTDVFTKANTLANATIQQFAESVTNRAGAALRLLNKDIEEGVAVLQVYADQGEKGQRAGEMLNIVLRDLQRAADENAESFEDMGVAVFDAQGKVRNIADIVGDLEVALEGASDRQRRATLSMLGFQDRSIQALAALLGTSEAIREYEKDLRNAGGTTQEVAENQLQSFTERLGLLRRRINETLQTGTIEPFFERMGALVDGALRNFDDLVLAISSLVRALTLLAAAFVAAKAPLMILNGVMGTARAISASYLVVVNGLRFGYYRLTAARTASTQALRAATIAQHSFNAALRASPVGIALTAVGLLTGAIIAYRSRKEEATQAERDFAEALEESNNKVKDAMSTMDQLSTAEQRQAVAQAIRAMDQEIEQAQKDLEKRMEDFGQGARLQFADEIEQIDLMRDQRRELQETHTLLGKLRETQKEIAQIQRTEQARIGRTPAFVQERLDKLHDIEKQMKIELGLVEATSKEEEDRASNTAKILENYGKIADISEDIAGLNQAIDESNWLDNMVESGLIDRAENSLESFNDEMTRLNNLRETGNISEEEFLKRSNERAEAFREELRQILLQLAKAGIESAELQRIIERAFGAASSAIQDTGDDIEDTDDKAKQLNSTFGDLAEMTSSMINLADAFGLIDRNLSRVARSAVDALRNIDRFQQLQAQENVSGMAMAVPMIGAAAGVAGLIGGLVQHRREQSAQAAEQIRRMRSLAEQLRSNQRAIERNTEEMRHQSIIGSDVRDSDLEQARRLMGGVWLRDQFGNITIPYSDGIPIEGTEGYRARMDELADLMPDFFGPWRDMFNSLVESGMTQSRAWNEIAEDMITDFEQFTSQIGEYGESVGALVTKFRQTMELGGASLQEAWQELIRNIMDMDQDIPDDFLERLLDLDPEEHGDEIADIIRELFDGAAEFRGDLTPDEFTELLQFLLGQTDRGGTGQASQQVTRSTQLATSITEFQANEVVSLLSSIEHFVRRISADIRGEDFSGVSVPASVTASPKPEQMGRQLSGVTKTLNYADFRGAQIGGGMRESDIDQIADQVRKELRRYYKNN